MRYPGEEMILDKKSCALWILHADKIPPHIGISDATGFYSLKVKGKDEAVPLKKILQVIEKKKIPTLVYALVPEKVHFLKKVFSEFNVADSNGVTCLEPIKRATDISKADTVHELIRNLENNHVLGESWRLNLSPKFEAIPDYSREDILNRLKYLEQ